MSYWRFDNYSTMTPFGSKVQARSHSVSSTLFNLIMAILLVLKVSEIVMRPNDDISFFTTSLLVLFGALWLTFYGVFIWANESYLSLRRNVARRENTAVVLVEPSLSFSVAASAYDSKFQHNLNLALAKNRGPRFYPLQGGPDLYALTIDSTKIVLWTGIREPVAALMILRSDMVDSGRGVYYFRRGKSHGFHILLRSPEQPIKLSFRRRTWWNRYSLSSSSLTTAIDSK